MKKDQTRSVSTPKAARMLGVDNKTVRVWVKNGRLVARQKRVTSVGAVVLEIDVSSFKKAFLSKCIWCGKMFKALYPQRARYCSKYHKALHFYHNVKKPALARQRARR